MRNARTKSKVKSKRAKHQVVGGRWSVVGALLFLTLCLCASVVNIQAQTTDFTYQGRLLDSSLPPSANYDFQFSLWDAVANGTQVGTTQTVTGVAVANGIFTVRLDFGNEFPGSARFIQIAVRPAGGGAYTLLAPRQSITSAPHAIRSANAGNADTATTAGNVTGVVAVANGGTGSSTQNFVDLTTNQTVGGTKTFTNAPVADGSQLTNINGANITNNTINASALASDTFPNNRNLSLLGQRRWDLLGQRVTVGSNPQDATFDGANIWVANFDSGTVTKLRAIDGACVGTCTFAAGGAPQGVAFDGANIWVTNYGINNVTKLLASTGAPQGTFAVGSLPFGVAFDGANIWVANSGSNNVTKLRASDGACNGVVNPPTTIACSFSVGTEPNGVAFDGANIWVANQLSNNVTKLRASDGALQGTFAVGFQPVGVAFDGANIWVANLGSNNVTKLRASDGACAGVVGPPTAACTFAVGTGPLGVAFDGTNIWVVNAASNNVTKLRGSDGVVQGTFAVGSGPFGVAFDGANIWVTNAGSNNVTKLPVFP